MGKFDSRMQHIEAWVIAGAITLVGLAYVISRGLWTA
jgi:hypothetical protein